MLSKISVPTLITTFNFKGSEKIEMHAQQKNCSHFKHQAYPPFLFHFSTICSSSISLKDLELFLLNLIFFKAIINLL
jgi:hypothetical protein